MPGESGVVQSGKAHTAWEAGQESAFYFSKAQLIHTQDRRCLVCGGSGDGGSGGLLKGSFTWALIDEHLEAQRM